jgi:DNA mismatch repair protein MutS
LRDWIERPLASTAAIAERQRAVSTWVEGGAARAALREALRRIPDLERLAGRVACRKATPRDLGAVRDALQGLPAIVAALHGTAADTGTLRQALAGDPAIEALLTKALTDDPPPVSRDGGIIRTGYDERRDALHVLAHSGKQWIAELEASERLRSGIPSLKIGYNRVFGYYLEVTRAHLDKVPSDYERRQTLTTAERFVTPDLKVKEGEVLSATDKLQAHEHELFVDLRERVAGGLERLRAAADALARIDALSSLAEAAVRHAWTAPEVDDSDTFELDESRHPVVERLLPAGTFVPNDVRLDGRRQILLLTGPNMGGKSTYLRQIALAVVLAQAGSYVPARRARIGLVDRLFTRVGASDRLGAGQSTFMVEMSETAGILRSATPRSLVLLDELGRGTATYDGLALAWAVTEHLHDARGPRPRTVFATHYHELTQLADELKRLVNVHVSVKEWGRDLVFLHRIAEGAADRSYGIHVARLAGLPEPVLRRAEEVLHELESERTVDHLAARGGAPKPAPVPAPLPLFETAVEHPLVAELRALDPEATTPLEALARLAEWRKRYS